MARVWPLIRRQGRHTRLRQRVAELEQQAAVSRAERQQALSEVSKLRARVLAGEALRPPGAASPSGEPVPVELTAAIAANCRDVKLPGCVALLSCSHGDPCQPGEVWEAVQRVTAAGHTLPAGSDGERPMPLPRYEVLPHGLRGVVTGKGDIVICSAMPPQSQWAARREARAHGVAHGWLSRSSGPAVAAATAAAMAVRPALAIVRSGAARKGALAILGPIAIGTAAAIILAVAPGALTLRPAHSTSPAPAAVTAAPHLHRRRENAAAPDPRPLPSTTPAALDGRSASPDPAAAPSGSLVPSVPPVVRSVAPVPTPSVRLPKLCVRILMLHTCLPEAA